MKIPVHVLIVLAVLAGLILTSGIAGILGVQTGRTAVNLSNSGNLVNIGVNVYSDADGQTAISNIDWGTLSPGGIVRRTVYVKNTGNENTTLSMTVSNWTPATASEVLPLSWDRQNYILPPGETVKAVITLTVAVDPGNLTSFSFTLTIAGTW